MFGIDGLRRVRHDRDGHPRHHRQARRAAARAVDGPRHARATRSRSSTRTPASSAPRARSASCGCAGTRGIQLFLEYYDNPEANAKAFEDGWFKTGDMVVMGEGGDIFYRERDKDLLKVGGENVSAKEVEDVVGDRRRRRPGRGGRQAPRVPRRGGGGLRDHGAGRPRRRHAREARSSRPAGRTWPTSRCPRAVYFVDDFPPAPSTRSSRTSSASRPTSVRPSDRGPPGAQAVILAFMRANSASSMTPWALSSDSLASSEAGPPVPATSRM